MYKCIYMFFVLVFLYLLYFGNRIHHGTERMFGSNDDQIVKYLSDHGYKDAVISRPVFISGCGEGDWTVQFGSNKDNKWVTGYFCEQKVSGAKLIKEN